MSTIPITKDKFLERCRDLEKLEIEVLDKFRITLESIPLPILELFPNFDPDSFKKLQELLQHVRTQLRLVRAVLLKLRKDEKKISESPETPESILSK